MALELGPPLPCPKCRHTLESVSWRDARHARCRWCETESEFRPYPAFHAKAVVARPQAVVVGDDATCFFHATNQAAAICGGCGRLLCAVCSVPYDDGVRCPACISSQRKKQDHGVTSRFLWGGAALTLAILPGLVWPVTLFTAPATVVVAVLGWRRPDSLVRSSRWKLILAGVLGLAEIGLWISAFVALATL